MTNNERLIWASGFYLTDHLTEALLEGADDELDQFILDYVWEPFEYWSADSIYEQIEGLARSVNSLLKEQIELGNKHV